jgi:hypothetical protein
MNNLKSKLMCLLLNNDFYGQRLKSCYVLLGLKFIQIKTISKMWRLYY